MGRTGASGLSRRRGQCQEQENKARSCVWRHVCVPSLVSEPSLRLVWAQNQPKSAKYRVFLHTWKRPGMLPVSSILPQTDFAPDQLSDSGKVASFQNGAPNTLCFPWKFPETQRAGARLFSFLFAGKVYTGQQINLVEQVVPSNRRRARFSKKSSSKEGQALASAGRSHERPRLWPCGTRPRESSGEGALFDKPK